MERDEQGRHYLMEPDFISENFSNANARLILQALNLCPDDCGSIAAHEIAKLTSVAIKLVNSDRLQKHTRSPSVEKGPQGASLIDCGLDQDDLKLKLNRLLSILIDAQKRGTGIYWG